jgi:hypothetical protein
MKHLVFIAVIMTGCSQKKNTITFNPTASMCIDSLIANMQIAGCDVISAEKATYGVSKISCISFDKKKLGEASGSSYLQNDFFSISYGTKIPSDVKPICTDPFVLLATAERD